MHRCSYCLYRTGEVLSRGVGVDSQIFHLAMPGLHVLAYRLASSRHTHPAPALRYQESRGATLHVDVLLSFATTCFGRRAFGPLWHEHLCSTFVCAFVGFLCRVWGRSEVGRDAHLVTCLLLFYTDHVPGYEERACSARSHAWLLAASRTSAFYNNFL